jgi:hypothetical protein
VRELPMDPITGDDHAGEAEVPADPEYRLVGPEGAPSENA